MDVSLGVLRRLDLDHQVDVGDVEAAGCDVGGDQDGELALLESLEGDLTLVLGDVTVHHLNVLLNLVRQDQLVRVRLSLSEHDGLTLVASIDTDYYKIRLVRVVK
jgi:hypothetical protein